MSLLAILGLEKHAPEAITGAELQIAKLQRVFAVFGSEDEAITKLSGTHST